MTSDSKRTNARKRPQLIRAADGSLQPDTGDHELADVWAEQRRIGLAESIAQDRRRAAKDRIRRERGLVGLAAVELRILTRRIRIILFGTQSVRPSAPQPAKTTDAKPSGRAVHAVTEADRPATNKPQDTSAKTERNVEITLAMPSLRRPSLHAFSGRIASVFGTLSRVFRRIPRRVALAGAVVVVLVIIVLGAFHFIGTSSSGSTSGAPNSTSVGSTAVTKPSALQKGTPDYDTIVPSGKDIASLGGWTRVSPPDRNPVYAYADRIGSIGIAVSEQPLPASFKRDTAEAVQDLAKSYNATQKITVGDDEAYIGTSAKGPQSVIFTRKDLLILIKSDAPLTTDQWTQYIRSLR